MPKLSRYDEYLQLNQSKFDGYLEEGFSEPQLRKIFRHATSPFVVVMNACKKKLPLKNWRDFTNYVPKRIYGLCEKGQYPEVGEYLFDEPRFILEKDYDRFVKFLKYDRNVENLPAEKLSRYAEIGIEILNDYMTYALDKFREEIAEKELEENTHKNAETFVEKVGKKNSSARLERIRKVNEHWQEQFANDNKENQNPNNKLRWSEELTEVKFIERVGKGRKVYKKQEALGV